MSGVEQGKKCRSVRGLVVAGQAWAVLAGCGVSVNPFTKKDPSRESGLVMNAPDETQRVSPKPSDLRTAGLGNGAQNGSDRFLLPALLGFLVLALLLIGGTLLVLRSEARALKKEILPLQTESPPPARLERPVPGAGDEASQTAPTRRSTQSPRMIVVPSPPSHRRRRTTVA